MPIHHNLLSWCVIVLAFSVMQKYRVGLLVDTLKLKTWQASIITYLRSHPSCDLCVVVLNKGVHHKSGKWMYRLLRKADRWLFKAPHDAFVLLSGDDLLKGVAVLEVTPGQTVHRDRFKEEDISRLKTYDTDLLIRFGFRILSGEILRVPRQGIWSLHHGDAAVNRGGPPGFWEVVNRIPVSGVTLQILSASLDGGKVLGKAFTKTNSTSFNRNQSQMYWSGVELMVSGLKRFFDDGHVGLPVEDQGFAIYSMPLYKDPGNLRSFLLGIQFLFRRLGEQCFKMLTHQQWALHHAFHPQVLETALFRYKKIRPPSGCDCADPFVIRKGEHYYVFFEELIRKTGKGQINCLTFHLDGKPVSKLSEPVLEMPYHLSYPFVFEYEGEMFMTPEAGEDGKVSLYQCTTWPAVWKLRQVLLHQALYDPTLIHWEGKWYMFGTRKPYPGSSTDQYLEIYYADSLFDSEWIPHPMNPVKRTVLGSRPAGRIFRHEGKLIRPAQLGAPKYGYGIVFMEILALTPHDFAERQVSRVEGKWSNQVAVHTFNAEGGFSLVDAQTREFFWN